jgi:hypothetical protein
MTNIVYHLAQLRHAYAKLKAGEVVEQAEFADGLIAPAICALEKVFVTDEMVDRAAKALEKRIKQDTYGWSDEDFETWWNRDSRFFKQIHVWGWFKGTEKEKCLHEARIVLEAALVKA